MNGLDQARKFVSKSKRAVVLTGAGISAESGIPTFRDAMAGLWSEFRPEELASPEGFRKNPPKVWQWYAWRREKVLAVEPNPGHLAIAAWQERIEKLTVVTQNVDGLHQKAGSSPVLELHGALNQIKCSQHQVPQSWPDPVPDSPPKCSICNEMMRPNVVWFGEMLPQDQFEQAQVETAHADLVLVIGTSGLVYPAASLPHIALQQGITIIEVNPEQTGLSEHASCFLQGPAASVLPQLLQ